MRPKQQQLRSLARRMAFSPTLFWWATTTVAMAITMAITMAMTKEPFGGFVATAWIHSSPILSPFRHCNGGSFCAASAVFKNGRSRFPTTTVALASSYGQDNGSGGNNNDNTNNSNNDQTTPEYRSIADVVGGLHGGKYQFGGGVSGGAFSDDAFSGHGGSDLPAEPQEQNEDDLPNWAKNMVPKPSSPSEAAAPLLRVPSNSNPMDGMVYFASIDISNQERAAGENQGVSNGSTSKQRVSRWCQPRECWLRGEGRATPAMPPSPIPILPPFA